MKDFLGNMNKCFLRFVHIYERCCKMLERIGTTENIGRNWFEKMFYTILVTDHVPSDPKIPSPLQHLGL